MPRRLPFHAGIFYHAMVGLIGRTPDNKYGTGNFYSYDYDAKDAAEFATLKSHENTLVDWLCNYDLLAFDSRLDFVEKDLRMRVRIKTPDYED